MNAIQAEKKMDKILKKYNLINDITTTTIKKLFSDLHIHNATIRIRRG